MDRACSGSSVGLATRAYLLDAWIREDAGPGSAARSPVRVGGTFEHMVSPGPDLFSVVEHQLFPHVDAALGIGRAPIGRTPVAPDQLGPLLDDALFSGHPAPSRRTAAMATELRQWLGAFVRDAAVVEVVDSATGRSVEDELHVVVHYFDGVVRLSVLPEASADRPCDPFPPDPACRAAGRTCGCGGLTPTAFTMADSRLRAACAADILAHHLPARDDAPAPMFDVRWGGHAILGEHHRDPEAVLRRWAASPWPGMLDPDPDEAPDLDEAPDPVENPGPQAEYASSLADSLRPVDIQDLRADLAASVDESLRTMLWNVTGPDTYMRYADVELPADRGTLLGTHLFAELLDRPLRLIGGPDADLLAFVDRATSGWGSATERGLILVAGPHEAVQITVDQRQ